MTFPIFSPPSTPSPEEKAHSFGHVTLLERYGQPADQTLLFVFLASNASIDIIDEVVGISSGQLLS